MNIKAISRYVGIALLVSAFFMLLSIGISIIDGFDSGFTPLLVGFLMTLSLGAFPFIFVQSSQALTIREGYVVIILSWFLSFVLGMIPYVIWGGPFTVVNAWFESVSGFTTTGSTILTDIEQLPRSLLLWRSSTHFIGGLGVVVFLLMVIPPSSPLRQKLSNLELSSLSRDTFNTRTSDTLKIIITVYIGLFVIMTGLLTVCGMPLFDSVNHAFSTVATGGFSIKNDSVGFYDSGILNLIFVVFMIVASCHFALVYYSVSTRSLRPMGTPVVRYFLLCIVVLTVISTLSLRFQTGGAETWQSAVSKSVFEVVSYITTCGFAVTDNSAWPPIACAALLLASFQCGCAGSTSGGLKADRMLIAFKALQIQIRKQQQPNSVQPVRLGGRVISDSLVRSVVLYIMLYILIIVVGATVLLLINVPVDEAVTGSLASVSNVGPGLGKIGCAGNYSHCMSAAKVIYSLEMILGRLEIYPVLSCIAVIFNRERQ